MVAVSNTKQIISRKYVIKTLSKNWMFLVLIIPGTLYFIIFSYIPMLGLNIAFRDYFPGGSLFWGNWVGIQWFKEFFSSYYFGRLLRNTVLLSFYNLIFGFPAPILFALVLTEVRLRFLSKVTQVVSYLPYFISTVVVVGMLINLLSPNNGIINAMLNRFGIESINFMSLPSWFRTIFVSSSVWQSFGFGSIIYMSAITSINQEIYESASIDGAGRLGQIWHITIPGILPTIILLLLLSLGSILSVSFEKVILMYSPSTYETADVIGTFVYRKGLLNAQFSYAAAVGLFNSVINVIFLISFNYISRKYTEISLW